MATTPPASRMRFSSPGSVGLWSRVAHFTPPPSSANTARESPAFATTTCVGVTTAATAVQPHSTPRDRSSSSAALKPPVSAASNDATLSPSRRHASVDATWCSSRSAAKADVAAPPWPSNTPKKAWPGLPCAASEQLAA